MRFASRLTSILLVAWGAGCSGGASSTAAEAATSSSASPPAASSVPATPAGPAAASESLPSVEARLDRMLSSASHCTADADCRSVAVGGKACGGPTGYRAYSTRLADPAAVEALARQESQLALQAEREAHGVSNCLFMADPGAHCEKQRCETGTMGAPAPAKAGPSTR
jgi:hypothetical protein